MEARQRINKNTYASPVGDRNKDDAYGLKDKALNSENSDNTKPKRKLFLTGSNSNRKNKVKSKQANYQPVSGKIDLVSRNDRSVTQVREENNKTLERGKTKSKNRFLVSKKYNNRMVSTKAKHSKDTIKSYLANSMKFASGPSTSMSKYAHNHTNIGDNFTPTSTTSNKINIKGSLLSKKKVASYKKSKKQESTKEEAKNYKKIKSLLKN
eukprot:CAMPEP_0197018484 /NCGR_PEP_ID=MMETSP1380-20130617/80129_1 /TAXON_ID=5936 /ORGANISM="Euplotes crassus, Strain CT5" /LENGTH=209 /DNA_ID=CAMNT_0042445709 /DNA_START=813 /DNA_END=1443 /DNA_ORIENTATION=-